MTAVVMVSPVSIVVTGVVMAVWADLNLFCGCHSLCSGRVGSRGVVNVSVSYCLGKRPGESKSEGRGWLYFFFLL